MKTIVRDELYKEIYNEVSDLLSKKEGDAALSILADILMDYDLNTASNMVRQDCDPRITKNCLDFFDEGDENAGFINLSAIISDYQEILNCDDSINDVVINKVLRLETEEEMAENGHTNDVNWYTENTDIDINKLILNFQ